MLIHVKKSAKIQSENRVFLVRNLSELKKLNLSTKEGAYFVAELKDNKWAFTNNAGVFTFVCIVEKLAIVKVVRRQENMVLACMKWLKTSVKTLA